MKVIGPLALTFASCVAIVSHAPEALACGGCFHGIEDPNPSVVTGHRMALSISPTRTVLWDQVEYAGDPADFAWVLPVGPGAYVEEADDAFFEALEAVTATRISSTTFTCNDVAFAQAEGSSGGCGSSDFADVPPSAPGDDLQQGAVRGVTVLHEGTVGPYETVTLQSIDPQALRTWLTLHKYAIPADIEPVIDAYVGEGANFIVLRLAPGQGVRQMTPVRVITPGASNILPLRMVAAGTGANVSIVLYMIGEGRYQAAGGRSMTTILPADLTWDWNVRQSNYASLRDERLADGSFLTSFSRRRAMHDGIPTTDGSLATYDVIWPDGSRLDTYDNLVDLYFGQAEANDGIEGMCNQTSSVLRAAADGAEVVAPCDAANPDCVIPAGSILSTDLECDGHDDVATALLGMHPSDVWVTRLEANLPRAALETDLQLGAEKSQSTVENWMIAGQNANVPPCNAPQPQTAEPQPETGTICGYATRRSRFFDPTATAMAFAAILFGARRLRRRG